MSKGQVRITLKAYDHRALDVAAGKICETVKRTGEKYLDLYLFLQKLKNLLYLELYTNIRMLVNNSKEELTRDLSILKTQVKRRLMLLLI